MEKGTDVQTRVNPMIRLQKSRGLRQKRMACELREKPSLAFEKKIHLPSQHPDGCNALAKNYI